jgi:methionyl aminopeptidase
MRSAASLAWRLLGRALACCTPGVTTRDLDRAIGSEIEAAGALPILRGWKETPDGPAFPGSSCICVNEEAAHGIPGPRILRAGDVVSIDLSLRLNGWCADAARATVVGDGAPDARLLVDAVREAVTLAADAAKPSRRWSEVAAIVADVARRGHLRVAEGLSGHGIGRDLHEPPSASFTEEPTGLAASTLQDFTLRPGMVLTIEPVFILDGPAGPQQGKPALTELDDGFTVVTLDRAWACHEEVMVAVTRQGPRTLTAE